MASGLETIICPVKDLAVAKRLFTTAFGVPPYIDEPYYVASNVGGGRLIATVKDADGNSIGLLQDPPGGVG
jgi:hypothetical protein